MKSLKEELEDLLKEVQYSIDNTNAISQVHLDYLIMKRDLIYCIDKESVKNEHPLVPEDCIKNETTKTLKSKSAKEA